MIINDKKSLRDKFKKKRNNISKRDKLELDLKIKNLAISLIKEISKENLLVKIHIFLPIDKFNEVNTWLIYNELKNSKYDFYISVSNFKSNELINFLFNDETEIKKNKFGIPEPINGMEYKKNDFDITIVPLLCTDENGYRVGYGKGFYDKFLSKTSKKNITIGIGYFDPIIKITDTNDFDVRLKYYVNTSKVYKFNI